MPQRRGGRRREARAARPERDLTKWAPKTKLGRLVLAGEITTLGDAIQTSLPIREPEIVDVLLPETEDEVLDVNMVQRMTDSGRRVNFVITCIVGDRKSTRLNSSHRCISYAVFCLKKKKKPNKQIVYKE